MQRKINISVIIVLYNPSDANIRQIMQTASMCPGIIVDNSSCANFASEKVGLMTYMPLYKNHGIAAAQNIALRKILADETAEFVVFLDQDSELTLDYVVDIANEYKRIKAEHDRLVILGPTVMDKETKEEYKSVIHHSITDSLGLTPKRDVISSGSCIELQTFRKVGLFDESLFIDFVDFEWCWRAEAMGYICGITSNKQILHKVGNRQLSIGNYKVIVSAPIRYFYQYRNHLWLCKRSYVPKQWKFATTIKHFARLIYFPIFVKDGFNCWKYMVKGIKAALTNAKSSI